MLCLFSSYSHTNYIHNYIKFYLTELNKNCTNLVFITNRRIICQNDLLFLSDNNIDIFYVENYGFDFGMWYEYIMVNSSIVVGELMLVNDSAILYTSLDNVFIAYNDIKVHNELIFGLIDSYEIKHHIQSYFVIYRGVNLIQSVFNYIIKNGKINDHQGVVLTYEIEMFTELKLSGYKSYTMFNCNVYNNISINPSIHNWIHMSNDGFPLIKRKLLYNNLQKYTNIISDIIYTNTYNISTTYLLYKL